MDFKNMTIEELLSGDTVESIVAIEDDIERTIEKTNFLIRAGVLKCKREASSLYKAIESQIMQPMVKTEVVGETNFDFPASSQYMNMKCGAWRTDDRKGIYASVQMPPYEIFACSHPILPIKRMVNMETGQEQIVLAFKRNSFWRELKVPKSIVSNSSKIVALADYGIWVTSETARNLVRYLSDVERLNDNDIEVVNSTSKLGWHGDDFIPYDTDIVFDGDNRFSNLFESIKEEGADFVWLDHVKELRATGRMEIKFLLAASFASVLVGRLNILPFFVDLWGETEGGKSVSLMLAASVWANPADSQYIGDYKSTDLALEVRADLLNSLPVFLDDSSNATSKIIDDFENIVYRLCSGKGKSRSNKDLGINRENNWRTCFITNGEKPLSAYCSQGGAFNRILEVESQERIFEDPAETVELLKQNYGFAGKQFIEIIKSIPLSELKKRYRKICDELEDDSKMQKQTMSLACVLLADQIATEHIFEDGEYIDIEEAKELLLGREYVSDNERCYQYLVEMIQRNQMMFDNLTYNRWGIIEDDYAYLFPTKLTELCKAEGFSKESFIKWGRKRKLFETDTKGQIKQKKIGGSNVRAIRLKFKNFEENDEFTKISSTEELPFE